MIQPGRKYSASDSYRYGFNGEEKSDEVYGEGNLYDYGFRIYNPRLGRFLSVDPISKNYPWYTPYQFAGNKPIECIDLDGLEEIKPWEFDKYEELVASIGPINTNTTKTVTTSQASAGMNLSFLKAKKQSYENTSWTNSVANPIPFGPTKQSTFVNNAVTSGWNQGVGSVEFTYNYWTSQKYRKDFTKSTIKALFNGLLWLVSSSNEEKWEDAKEELSDVNNYEDAAGSLLLAKVSDNFVKTPVAKYMSGRFIIGPKTLARITQHLENLGFKELEINQEMLKDLQKIVRGEMKATDIHTNFAKHEIREFEYMKLGHKYEEAHYMVLKEQGMYHPDYDLKLYTKKALDAALAAEEKAIKNK
jgi:RHS repeat-associated protein